MAISWAWLIPALRTLSRGGHSNWSCTHICDRGQEFWPAKSGLDRWPHRFYRVDVVVAVLICYCFSIRKGTHTSSWYRSTLTEFPPFFSLCPFSPLLFLPLLSSSEERVSDHVVRRIIFYFDVFFCSLTDLSRPNLREISRFAYSAACEISPVSIIVQYMTSLQ